MHHDYFENTLKICQFYHALEPGIVKMKGGMMPCSLTHVDAVLSSTNVVNLQNGNRA